VVGLSLILYIFTTVNLINQLPVSVYDERANIIYLSIFQIFSIWFIPFYRAPVRLVTVLHLTHLPPAPTGDGTPQPPPSHAAQAKLYAVQGEAEPSYAAVTAGETSPPTRYVITKQQDLYQVNEFLKFVAMTPGSVVAGFLQLLGTLLCLAGVLVMGRIQDVLWPLAKGEGGKERRLG